MEIKIKNFEKKIKILIKILIFFIQAINRKIWMNLEIKIFCICWNRKSRKIFLKYFGKISLNIEKKFKFPDHYQFSKNEIDKMY